MSQTASHQATLTVNTSAPIVSSQQPNTGADVKITVSNAAFPAGSSSLARSARSSAPLHVMATACLRGDASFVYTDGNPLPANAPGGRKKSCWRRFWGRLKALLLINWASLLRKLRAIKKKVPRTSIFAPGFFTSA
ncbi:hypothetical protein NLJ89_g606 [Agrocybe chaxingu]|uniref:Uncharacterized protein n=1 Tax=Agrocybe chaxingu TaxID=84603 RepID=A0A9W8N1M6_9AGAR|nr:hypothetical protein NLJ89_g606 [Agrocybe chaxingu]